MRSLISQKLEKINCVKNQKNCYKQLLNIFLVIFKAQRARCLEFFREYAIMFTDTKIVSKLPLPSVCLFFFFCSRIHNVIIYSFNRIERNTFYFLISVFHMSFVLVFLHTYCIRIICYMLYIDQELWLNKCYYYCFIC